MRVRVEFYPPSKWEELSYAIIMIIGVIAFIAIGIYRFA